MNHIKIFTKVYETSEWGERKIEGEFEGSSGGGSSVEFNKEYIKFIKNFIDEHGIKKIVDLGCGDWQSSYLIYENKNISYWGYDAYEKVISHNNKKYPQYTFKHCDILNDIDLIENGDLCIIKDVLQHWTCEEINNFMNKLLLKKYKYIIITNCCAQKYDNQDEPYRSRPLSIKYEPLKSYNFKLLFNYKSKEVSLLTL